MHRTYCEINFSHLVSQPFNFFFAIAENNLKINLNFFKNRKIIKKLLLK